MSYKGRRKDGKLKILDFSGKVLDSISTENVKLETVDLLELKYGAEEKDERKK